MKMLFIQICTIAALSSFSSAADPQPIPNPEKLRAATAALQRISEKHPDALKDVQIALQGVESGLKYMEESDRWQRKAADLIVKMQASIDKLLAAIKAMREGRD